MRKIWVRIDIWDKELVTTAIEGGADGIMVPPGCSKKVKELGKVLTIADDGDLKPGKDVAVFTIRSGEDEQEIFRLSQDKPVILQTSDWTIIPLENLIAKKAEVIAQVNTPEEAKTAFGILERGVSHILYRPESVLDLKNTLAWFHAGEESIDLTAAKILEVRSVGMGDRVCVDTCTSMGPGEGMLVGNSSGGLFLVHAESISNPYVSPRPFRVNAGPVHAYTRVPDGKTRYLSELTAGDPVLIVDYTGKTNIGVVGRLKIEKRPLMLIRAEMGEKVFSTILQNAETIRLTAPDGSALSVVNLQHGDHILLAAEHGGRHFGMKIEETITEK
jgi:3-dehydroquinate synthase II